MNKKLKKFSSGSTMIEILIATSVVGMVMTAIAASFTLSAKNAFISQQQIEGVARAQEGLEVFRRERALLGWDRFSEALSTGQYCLDYLPLDTNAFLEMVPEPCEYLQEVPTTIHVREAIVDKVSPDEIMVRVESRWGLNAVLRTVEVTQEFRRYDN